MPRRDSSATMAAPPGRPGDLAARGSRSAGLRAYPVAVAVPLPACARRALRVHQRVVADLASRRGTPPATTLNHLLPADQTLTVSVGRRSGPPTRRRPIIWRYEAITGAHQASIAPAFVGNRVRPRRVSCPSWSTCHPPPGRRSPVRSSGSRSSCGVPMRLLPASSFGARNGAPKFCAPKTDAPKTVRPPVDGAPGCVRDSDARTASGIGSRTTGAPGGISERS